MRIKEIISCYVSETTVAPEDFDKLRESFTHNGYKEKALNEHKWLYKKGASLALEFDYNSESIEMQVILEKLDNTLKVSVGNWGFPFEPLMMKKRFVRNLTSIIEEIKADGVLTVNKQQAIKITKSSKKKNKAAIYLLTSTFVFACIYALIKNT